MVHIISHEMKLFICVATWKRQRAGKMQFDKHNSEDAIIVQWRNYWLEGGIILFGCRLKKLFLPQLENGSKWQGSAPAYEERRGRRGGDSLHFCTVLLLCPKTHACPPLLCLN
jgi:hypothetical protein